MVTTFKPQSAQPLASDSVLLRNISWKTFQALIDDLESQPSRRLTYDQGNLEIWMPSPPHERYKKLLARLVESLTEGWDIEICGLGFCTWNREDLVKGLEPDECYYIQNEPVVRGRMDINLAVDPPPDLAIEVDMTSLSIPRLSIYAALCVPEVWRFDGSELMFLSLVDEAYQKIEQSLVLPLAQPDSVLALLEKSQSMGENSWAKTVRRWAQDLKRESEP